MRSRYRRRASPSPSLTAMASTARRAPRGTSPVPPFPLSPGVDSVTADRDPPVRLPYASLAPLPYGAPPLSRVPPGAPQRLRHRRRRQDSLLHGAPAGETPSTCTLLRALSRYREGSLRDTPRVLPRYLGRYPSLYAVPQYVPGIPRRPVRRPSASAPGSTAPVPLQEVLPSPAGRSVLPRYDAPDPSHGRVLLLAQDVPPPPRALSRYPGTFVGDSLRISIAIEPSPPAIDSRALW